MNKKYIGFLYGDNKIEVKLSTSSLPLSYWDGGLDIENEFRIIDDIIMCQGNTKDEVKTKLNDYLQAELCAWVVRVNSLTSSSWKKNTTSVLT